MLGVSELNLQFSGNLNDYNEAESDFSMLFFLDSKPFRLPETGDDPVFM